jgi:hypothetical protein
MRPAVYATGNASQLFGAVLAERRQIGDRVANRVSGAVDGQQGVDEGARRFARSEKMPRLVSRPFNRIERDLSAVYANPSVSR